MNVFQNCEENAKRNGFYSNENECTHGEPNCLFEADCFFPRKGFFRFKFSTRKIKLNFFRNEVLQKPCLSYN